MEHVIDAKGKILGRIAAEIASILRGKNSVSFQPNKAPAVKVIVENIGEMKVTGKKMEQKKYKSHSGYPGSLKERKMSDVTAKKGMGHILAEAVEGMLPPNRLRKQMMKNLIIK